MAETYSKIQESQSLELLPETLSPQDAERTIRADILALPEAMSLDSRMDRLKEYDGAKSLVIGSGNAGLESAWALLEAGHFVVIVEADDLPGGLGSSVGAKNKGGLSAIEKPKKRREVSFKAMQVLEHPNALFLPHTYIDPQDTATLQNLGFDGIVIAAGGKEKIEKRFDYTHPSIMTSKQIIEGSHDPLDSTGRAASIDALLGGKRIARDAEGKPKPVLVIGGGNIAIQDVPKHIQGMLLQDAVDRKYADGRVINIENAVHGAGILKAAAELGISASELEGGTIVVYRSEKGLMRPMEPQEKYILANIDAALSKVKASDAALAAITIDMLDSAEYAELKDRVWAEAKEMARHMDEFKTAVRRNVDVITAKQGIFVMDETTVESIDPMDDGGLKVTLRHAGGTVTEIEAGAVVTAIGFESQPMPHMLMTPVVAAGMYADGRGNLEASAKSAKSAVDELLVEMKKDEKLPTRQLNIAELQQYVDRAKATGFDGNVVSAYLTQGPEYYTNTFYLSRAAYDGVGNRPPEIKPVSDHIVVDEQSIFNHSKQHEVVSEPEIRVAFGITYALQSRVEQVLSAIPFLRTGIREEGDITLSPYQEHSGRVSHMDILFRGQPTGLRITETALEFIVSDKEEPIRVSSGRDLVYFMQYANRSISEGMLRLPEDINRRLEILHRDALANERIVEGIPRYRIQSIQDIPQLVRRELRSIVADAIGSFADHVQMRTIRDRRGIVGYEWYRLVGSSRERVLRTNAEGKVTWGWGYLRHGLQAFTDQVENMRADIAQSLVIPSVDRQIRRTPEGIASVTIISGMVSVSLDGQVEVRQSPSVPSSYSRNYETTEGAVEVSVLRITSDRKLRQWLRLQRVSAKIASEEEVRSLARREMTMDSALYTAATLAGIAVSAGMRNIGHDPWVLGVISALAIAPTIVVHNRVKEIEQSLDSSTRVRKKQKLIRRAVGAAKWFLIGFTGENVAHVALPDAQEQRVGQQLSSERLHGHTEVQHVEAPQPDAAPAPSSQSVEIYAGSGTSGEVYLEPSTPVLAWGENPTNAQLREYFVKLYAESGNGTLAAWKQYTLEGWASKWLNHNGWRAPTDVEMELFSKIAHIDNLATYIKDVLPVLRAHSSSLAGTMAVATP